MQKRLKDAFDPTPMPRKMYDDLGLAQAAEVPGPGSYSPRLRGKDSSGCTFGAAPFVSNADGQATVHYDRDAGSPDAWRVKTAASQPGPASYTPQSPSRHNLGSTFGLSPKLRGEKQVPSAHDMSKMVAHLRDLPAPDAYSPRELEHNKGFRMVPSKAKTMLEHVEEEGRKVPGPGTYDLSGAFVGPLHNPWRRGSRQVRA